MRACVCVSMDDPEEWRLETGRTHQIRVHTREIGHPILGDDVYGGGGGSAAERLHRKAGCVHKS